MRDDPALQSATAVPSGEQTVEPRPSAGDGAWARVIAFVTAPGRYVAELTRAVFAAYWADDLMGLAAEMAYNFLFALFPFFVFLAALLGFIGSQVGHADLFTQVMVFIALLGPEAIQNLVRDWVHSVVYTRSPELLTLGAALSLFGATAGISTLTKGLDRAHKAPGGRPFWKSMLIALLATVALCTVMLAGFVTYALGAWILERVPPAYGVTSGLRDMIELSRGLVITAGLFIVLTLLYAALPTARVPLRHAAAGALFATIAWTVITRGFGVYLAYLGQFSGTYGAFAAGIVLMVWMYAVGTVLLLGGEISALSSRGRLSRSS